MRAKGQFEVQASGAVRMSRAWAMPNPQTFEIPPIAEFLDKYGATTYQAVVDPFSGQSLRAVHRNDLRHGGVDAEVFCRQLLDQHGPGWADVVLFDPPYSPRQIVEVYQSVGLTPDMKTTQNGALYKRVRDALWPLLKVGGVALSFGWNSGGFGKGRGAVLEEVLLVAHGGAHNDTICVAERKVR